MINIFLTHVPCMRNVRNEPTPMMDYRQAFNYGSIYSVWIFRSEAFFSKNEMQWYYRNEFYFVDFIAVVIQLCHQNVANVQY